MKAKTIDRRSEAKEEGSSYRRSIKYSLEEKNTRYSRALGMKMRCSCVVVVQLDCEGWCGAPETDKFVTRRTLPVPEAWESPDDSRLSYLNLVILLIGYI